MDEKEMLRDLLGAQRRALVWKLEGLSERQVRLPLTPTGSNLLGIVKHVASVEQGYLGPVLGRGEVEPTPWSTGDEDNADMFATAEQSRDWVLDFYARVAAASEATIDALALEAEGTVPWWPAERNPVTLRQLLLHLIAETARHTGQADVLRESIDGRVGYRPGNDNLPPGDQAWWRDYRDRLQQIADSFG